MKKINISHFHYLVKFTYVNIFKELHFYNSNLLFLINKDFQILFFIIKKVIYYLSVIRLFSKCNLFINPCT